MDRDIPDLISHDSQLRSKSKSHNRLYPLQDYSQADPLVRPFNFEQNQLDQKSSHYPEYSRIYLANIILKTKVKQLQEEKKIIQEKIRRIQLKKKLEKLDKENDKDSSQQSIHHSKQTKQVLKLVKKHSQISLDNPKIQELYQNSILKEQTIHNENNPSTANENIPDSFNSLKLKHKSFSAIQRPTEEVRYSRYDRLIKKVKRM